MRTASYSEKNLFVMAFCYNNGPKKPRRMIKFSSDLFMSQQKGSMGHEFKNPMNLFNFSGNIYENNS